MTTPAMTTLVCWTRSAISFREALDAVFAPGTAVVMAASEDAYRVGSTPSPRTLEASFEGEAFDGVRSLRWTATSGARPFRGSACVLAEAGGEMPGWTREVVQALAAPARYACWGDVLGTDEQGVEVGDGARRFRIDVPGLGWRTSDRISLEAVEYIAAGEFGNEAVIDERLVRFAVDASDGEAQ